MSRFHRFFTLSPKQGAELRDAFFEKEQDALAAHDFHAAEIWRQAAAIVHDTRMNAFDQRAAKDRARRCKQLATQP